MYEVGRGTRAHEKRRGFERRGSKRGCIPSRPLLRIKSWVRGEKKRKKGRGLGKARGSKENARNCG